MKTVTLTELRRNLETYLDEAKDGDVVITKYGRAVAKLISTESESKPRSRNSSSSSADADAETDGSPVAA